MTAITTAGKPSSSGATPRLGEVYRLPSGSVVRIDDLQTGARASCSYVRRNGAGYAADTARGEVALTFEFLQIHARKAKAA